MQNYSQNIRKIEQKVRQYAATTFPNMAARKALRFIDDNFRNQSWAGLPNLAWQRRKGGRNNAGRALLIQKGALRRSFLAQTSIGQVRIFSNIPYAQAHNEGSREVVNIPAHVRRKISRVAVEVVRGGRRRTRMVQIHEGDMNVKAHTRQLNIKRRQFMPTAERPSSVFNDALKRQVTIDMYRILRTN